VRNLVSGLTAAITALVLGMLISGAADAARAADSAKQQLDAQAITADASLDQTAVDVDAYRTQLQAALDRLNAAYADLQARDTAYRELLATSQSNTERLQAANVRLQQQLIDAAARVRQAEAQVSAQTTPVRRESRDDD
jgi:chromosome segregation ATPase